MREIKIAAIIPARMGSSRFPGKPLLKINNLPMIEHVRRRALLCSGFSDVIVATCDIEIYDVVKKFNGKVFMTSPAHAMASDRIAEVAEKISCTHIVNVQGDEILVMPNDLSIMVNSIINNPAIDYWNAVSPLDSIREIKDSSIVKCILSSEKKILYCARDFSTLNLSKGYSFVKKILGLIAYTKKSLINFSNLNRTAIETSESIDQMRIIENGYCLHSIPLSNGYPGINEPREKDLVKKILNIDLNQKEILNKIISKS